MSDQRLEPQTAREALFEIRRLAAEVHVDTDPSDFGCEVGRVALEGLNRRSPINFEMTDNLADHLAQAHTVLRRIRAGGVVSIPELAGEISEALVLPTDLEAVVERRIGPER